jgi:hypothetical protein
MTGDAFFIGISKRHLRPLTSGVLGYWSDGLMGKSPTRHYSITPTLLPTTLSIRALKANPHF